MAIIHDFRLHGLQVIRAAMRVAIYRESLRCAKGEYIVFSIIDSCLRMWYLNCSKKKVGDHRPFIAALVVPDRKRIAADLKRADSAVTDNDLERILWERVERINEGLEHYEKIRKIVAVQQDFPDKIRSVTAFQKIKLDRKAVADIYQKRIEEIYGG